MIDKDYLKKIQQLAAENKEKGASRWKENIKELTDYLNLHRGNYKPLTPAGVARLVAYMKRGDDYSELEYFIKQVKEKGSWFFWWIVKPKK